MSLQQLARVDYKRCAAYHIKITDIPSRGALHTRQHNICREFLLQPEFSQCVISPQHRDTSLILIAGPKKSFENAELERFHHFLNQHSLVVSYLLLWMMLWSFSIALNETIKEQAKYRVGDDLVFGDFLSGSGPKLCPRISWCIKCFRIGILTAFVITCTSSGDVLFKIKPDTIRIFKLEQWQLEDFRGNSSTAISPRWAYCLPKLGRGRVVGVHRTMPLNSPFSDYKAMRNYWKTCYGYDLPAGEPEVYYDVHFNGLQSTFLIVDKPKTDHLTNKTTVSMWERFEKCLTRTRAGICRLVRTKRFQLHEIRTLIGHVTKYPFFCVLSSEPDAEFFREPTEKAEITKQRFIDALKQSNRNICGQAVNVDHASSAARGLHSALAFPAVSKGRNRVSCEKKRQNLDAKMPAPKREVPADTDPDDKRVPVSTGLTNWINKALHSFRSVPTVDNITEQRSESTESLSREKLTTADSESDKVKKLCGLETYRPSFAAIKRSVSSTPVLSTKKPTSSKVAAASSSAVDICTRSIEMTPNGKQNMSLKKPAAPRKRKAPAEGIAKAEIVKGRKILNTTSTE